MSIADDIGAAVGQAEGEHSFADLLEEATRHLQGNGGLDLEALVRAHPQHADQLRELIPAMAAMASWGKESGVEEQWSSGVEGENGRAVEQQRGELDGLLGDFRIIQEIGRGGMGVVYEAEQLSLRRRVALKVLPFAAVLDKRSLQRFKNEVLAAASLDHPNIVSVYFVGEERGVHFFAMQLVRGRMLADVIEELRTERFGGAKVGFKDSTHPTTAAERGQAHFVPRTAHDHRRDGARPVPNLQSEIATAPVGRISTLSDTSGREYFRAVARLGVEAGRALQHAHDQGVVHRDIKPGNLMLDSEGQLFITDFGLARLASDVTMTMTGDLLGTLRYMAPEQALGQRQVINHRADIYSLGATMYELLARVPAFGATDRSELLRRIAFDEPRALRKHDRRIPAELETIVHKAMAKGCEDRYQSAVELAEDLERFLEHKPIVGRPPGALERCVKWSRRHPASAALVAVVLLSLIGLSGGALWHARTLSAALRESEENRKLAETNERHALEREKALRHHKYAGRMKVASDAWATRNMPVFRDMMFSAAEDETEADLRGWEWRYLWSLCNSKCETLTGHRKAVSCITYSPDSKLLATSSEDGTVRIWDAATRRLAATLVGHTSCVNKVQFAPDGSWLATLSCDETVKIWDARTFAEVASLPHEFGVFGLAISPDGKTIAAGLGCDGGPANPPNDHVIIWDVATRKRKLVFTDHQSDVRAAVFAPDGTLVTGSLDGTIRRWNVSTGENLNTISHPDQGPVHCLACSRDGSTLVSGSGDRTAVVWDQSKWEPRVVLRSSNVILSVVISPDGATIATGNELGLVELWDTTKGTSKGSLLASYERFVASAERIGGDERNNRILSLAFSPDGTRLLSGSPEAVTKTWDLRRLPGVPSIFTLDTTSAEMAIDDSLESAIDLQHLAVVYRYKLEPGLDTRIALIRILI